MPENVTQIADGAVIVSRQQELPVSDACWNDLDVRAAQKMTSAKRRQDWYLGRLALKTLLAKSFSQSVPEIHVGSDAHGRPVILAPQDLAGQKISVSVAHKNPFVAAAYSCTENIGIDVETRNESQKPNLGDFIHSEEIRLDHLSWGVGPNDALRLLWTLKEAYFKAMRGSHLVQIKNSVWNVQPKEEPGILTANLAVPLEVQPIFVQVKVSDEYIVSVVTCPRHK